MKVININQIAVGTGEEITSAPPGGAPGGVTGDGFSVKFFAFSLHVSEIYIVIINILIIYARNIRPVFFNITCKEYGCYSSRAGTTLTL